MANRFSIFKIKGEERWVALVSFLFFATLNFLQLWSHWDVYRKASHVGFYTAYSRVFKLSGYDAWSCVFMSNGQIYFETNRHPLFLILLYPFRWLNQLLISLLGVNCAMPIMALALVALAVWTAVFSYRFLREVLGMSYFDSSILTLMLFGFAHVMLPLVCPDHFAFSFFLLMLTLLVSGKAFKEHRVLSARKAGLLLFLTTGMATTNGAKTLLTDFFCNGRKMFSPRWLVTGVVLPLLLMGAVYAGAHYCIEVPLKLQRDQRDARMLQKQQEKQNTAFFKKQAQRDKFTQEKAEQKLGNGTITGLIDVKTPRLRSLWDNFFGESLQFHKEHLLEDGSFTRPVFVSYHNWWNDIVEGILILLLIAGVMAGRKERVMQMLVSWLALDIILFIVLGFAIDEVYIMTSGWAFIIPIGAAYLLKRLRGKAYQVGSLLTACFAVYLFIYNASLLIGHLVDLIQ